MELSTWRTDAGDFDVLADLPDRHGQHLRYEALAPRAVTFDLGSLAVQVAALGDVIASKEWADRPKDRDALLRELRRAEIALNQVRESGQAQRRTEPPHPG